MFYCIFYGFSFFHSDPLGDGTDSVAAPGVITHTLHADATGTITLPSLAGQHTLTQVVTIYMYKTEKCLSNQNLKLYHHVYKKPSLNPIMSHFISVQPVSPKFISTLSFLLYLDFLIVSLLRFPNQHFIWIYEIFVIIVLSGLTINFFLKCVPKLFYGCY